MSKTGLFYATGTDKTTAVANKIKEAFGPGEIEMIPIERAWKKDFEAFHYLIVGAATWFDGELPSDWDELLPELKTLRLDGRKVAIFGLGDQVNYPDNFVDSIGILAEVVKGAGAELVGCTSTEGYRFNRSKAVKNGEFLGLALDPETQPDKTDQRIHSWVARLKEEGFGR